MFTRLLSSFVKDDLLTLISAAVGSASSSTSTRSTYIDSTALSVLLDGLRRARALGGTISIVTQVEQMKRLFESLGSIKAFSLFEQEESALAAPLPRLA